MRRRFLTNIIDNSASVDTSNYLTIRALEDNLSISFSNDVEYNANGVGWATLANGQTVSVNKGEYVSFKKEVLSVTSSGIGQFTVSGIFGLEGNCMSMLFGDNAKNEYDLTRYKYAFLSMFENTDLQYINTDFLPATILSDSCYERMFSGCTYLVNPPELPATTLASGCYYGMFSNCHFSVAPKLPATILSDSCYERMFSGCTYLVNPPELPATTLAIRCYEGMFFDCWSLTQAPELPATKLVDNCYFNMFYKCTSLNYIKMLATDISANYCLYDWVHSVSSAGTFVKNKNAAWNVTGYSGIPTGWTVKTE